MPDLPVEFVIRMKKLLSSDWELFRRGAGDERLYGLRVNTLKISPGDFETIAPFFLERIPWIPNGYFVSREDEPAGHPFYAAGLYYLQEPSAMTPASRLKVMPGDRVLDLCAAPGGKATELAAGLAGDGLLVANDINRARCRALLRNLELFGVRNSMVTNEPPYVLRDRFPAFFDKIMVDAPCSGEGMFRKNPAVMESWLEKGPAYFSLLQKDIIVHAADMLKPNGQMLYSTCTFAPEENEGVITHLLAERPEMEIIPMDDYEGFSPGILSFDGQAFHEDCKLCRRIWPHRMAGEGHFLALLHKKESMESGAGEKYSLSDRAYDRSSYKKIHNSSSPKKADRRVWDGKTKKRGGREKENLVDISFLDCFLKSVDWPELNERLDIRGEKAYYIPDVSLMDSRLHFLRNGLYLGDFKKNRFEPSQPFALALSANTYDDTVNFSPEDDRLYRYLKGDSIMVDDLSVRSGRIDRQGDSSADSSLRKSRKEKAEMSYVLVMVEGYPIGWGKLTGNVIKNKYPPSWRRGN